MELSPHLLRAEADAVRAMSLGGALAIYAGRRLAVTAAHGESEALVILPLLQPPFTDSDDEGTMELRAAAAVARLRGRIGWFCLRDRLGRCLAHGSAGTGESAELRSSHQWVDPGDRVEVDEVTYVLPAGAGQRS